VGASHWTPYGCTSTPPLLLQASQPWVDTGVNVVTGDALHIVVSGTIKISGSDPGTGPVGDPSCTATGAYVAPGLPCYSVVARIGNGTPFEVGPDFHGAAPGAGRLYLSVNDGCFADNSGSFTVTINRG
jgi:hypothetical protein